MNNCFEIFPYITEVSPIFSGQYPSQGFQPPPMPAPGYVAVPHPVQQPTQQVVIIQSNIKYGKNPMTMTCPHCQSQIQTSIRSEPGPLGKFCSFYYLLSS